eukprot:7265129-Prymnesium_polylepis.1
MARRVRGPLGAPLVAIPRAASEFVDVEVAVRGRSRFAGGPRGDCRGEWPEGFSVDISASRAEFGAPGIELSPSR